MTKKRVAVLISGRGSNMAALIEAAKDASFPAEIELVLSNRPAAAGLEPRARRRRSPPRSSITRPMGKDREAFERACRRCSKRTASSSYAWPDSCGCLTPWFVRRWQGRMINIHPALLPAFKGLDTHERALAAGVKIHGASVHFVVPEMDAGPIIAQGAVGVRDDDTAATLAARVLAIEHRIYPAALALLAAGRITIVDGRCRIEGAPAPPAI